MKVYHLAIDIGASGGRHILGHLQDGKLLLEEVYRFENGMTEQNGTLVWDVDNLITQVKAGIAKCKELNKLPATVAIDTWGVDYLLLDEEKKELLPAVAYRDSRTEKGVQEVAKHLPQAALYARTGIQLQQFNTIYQLYCDKLSGKLQKAKYFLMMPEYLSFKLTGVIKNEYTNATTTNLVHAESKSWDTEILNTLGIPAEIFQPLSLPGTEVGSFTEEVRREVGFDAKVLLCPSHDTASAVAACPIDEKSVYISSGTWSLIGTENIVPVLSSEALEANFSNEGGIEYRFRFLKNIMGMWLFQSIRKELGKKYTYDEMMRMAMESTFAEQIDPADFAFLAPESMIGAVRDYLKRPELPLEDVLSSVYHSLAASYDRAVREIERISGKTVDAINIVGGGSKDAYLNRLTARYTGKKVLIGLMEATATGNLLSQMMATEDKTLSEMRDIIRKTFNITEVSV
ncbi:MAG: rhamnulokinase [Clostridia bacterium]|nr:rhamnulokinase [Clostridia bacterium]